jgi:glutathione synthase/RimK-type ligase-like ATP-grasp enzyme
MKKLGLWLPSRPTTRQIPTPEKPGLILDSVKSAVMDRLRKEKDIRIIEDIDFRKAVIRGNKIYLENFCLNDMDLFFWYGKIDRDVNSYHTQILDVLEKTTCIMNPIHAQKIGFDKFRTNVVLRHNGIPVPPNCLVSRENYSYAGKFIDEMGEVLLKPRWGGRGQGIIKISNKHTLMSIIEYSNLKDHLIEKFIPNDVKKYCGVNVINGKVIHGYTKKGENVQEGWKIQAKGGIDGNFTYVNPDKKQKEIALKIYKALKLDFFGVDIIKSLDGKYYAVDVNTFPGWYPDMFEKSSIDAIEEIVKAIKSHLREK